MSSSQNLDSRPVSNESLSESSPLLTQPQKLPLLSISSDNTSPSSLVPSRESSLRSFYPPISRRNVIAFCLALICSGCAGSISLFSMFAPSLQYYTNLQVMDINIIAIAAELGMYVPVPIIGYVADKFGPASVGILSAILFCPSYFISALIINRCSSSLSNINDISQYSYFPFLEKHVFHILVICFACIGAGTSSLHFCGVVTAAKVLPQLPGLSISGPIAAFGISSLWQSQIINMFFVSKDKDQLDHIRLSPVFKFFSILYIITGIVGYLASNIGTFLVTLAADNESTEEYITEPHTQQQQLLQPSQNFNSYDSVTNSIEGPSNNANTTKSVSNVTSKLGSKRSTSASYKSHTSIKEFLSDHTVWVFFFAFVLATGPLEMFVNNMGMIVNTIRRNNEFGSSVATHVSLFSAFSTLARLTMGILSDLVEHKISRVYILVFILLTTAISHFLLASGIFTEFHDGKYFYIASSSNGFSYGSAFTIVPTIVATVWGVERYGTNWGTFILGPALGASFYGYLFAQVYESSATGKPSGGNQFLNSIYEFHPNDTKTSLVTAPEFFAIKISETSKNLILYINSFFTISSPTFNKGGNLLPDSQNIECYGIKCYQDTFISTGVGFVISAILVLSVYLFSWKPHHKLPLSHESV